jgi:membrane-bound ClpP family serine protease
MTPALLIILLFAAGAVLLVLEMFLPAQGLVGLVGAAAIVWGIVQGFLLNQWLGLGLLAGTIACIPFAWTAVLHIWPRTPIGRRMMLGEVQPQVSRPAAAVGQRGKTLSELRPAGVCDFAGQRVEARAEIGTIPAGKLVRVVTIDQGRLIVRAIELTEEAIT